MKRRLLVRLAVTIGVAALVVMPVQQAKATKAICANCPVHCNDGTCQNPIDGCGDHGGDSPFQLGFCGGKAQLNEKRERRQLLAAYAAERRPSQAASLNPPRQALTVRSVAATGLSVFVLSLGLLALAKLIQALIAKSRLRLRQPQRARGAPLMKKGSLAYTMMAMLVFAALVIASSVGTDVAPAKQPGAHPAASPVTDSPLTAPAGNFTSAIEIGGTGTTQIGGTAIDSSGNLYVTGGFTGNIVFNTSPQTTLTSTQDDDLFVAKYDSSGHPIWARVANGATGLPAGLSLDGGLALAVDNQGNSYVGGGFVKTLSFKDANNTTVATLNSSGNMLNFELFVAKYDTNGTLLWAVGGMSASPQDAGDLENGINGITDIVVDGSGNPYVAGTVAGTSFLGKPVTVAGFSDVVVSRLNPATGAPVWVSVAGSPGDDAAMGLGIDNAANVYVMGEIQGTATFPTQPTPTTLTVDHGIEGSFVAKYNQNGQCLWAKELGSSQFIFGSHLSVNGAGQIYLTGEFEGSVTFGSTTLNDSKSGPSDSSMAGFLAKLDTDGQTWLWARGFDAEGERVALDGAGSPHITGAFFGSATFGAENSSTQQTLTSMGDEDQYVAKYDAAGNFHFAKALPGDGESSEDIIDSANVDVKVVPIRLVLNPATGALHVSGDFSGTLTLDGITLDSGSDRHGFVAAFVEALGLPSPPPTVSSINPNLGPTTGGTMITITGTNFSTSAAVTIGGVAATGVTVVNSTTITATSGPHAAGTVDVVVTNPDGQSATLANGFTYTTAPAGPVITGANAGRKHLIVTGSGFDNGAVILIDNKEQRTINDADNPTTTLIGLKVIKKGKIQPGQSVVLKVRNANGALSNDFPFTRPVQ